MPPPLTQKRQKDGHPTVLFVETEIGWATRPVDCIHKSITPLQTRRRTSENACRRLQTLDLDGYPLHSGPPIGCGLGTSPSSRTRSSIGRLLAPPQRPAAQVG